MFRNLTIGAFASLALALFVPAPARADYWDDYRERLEDLREERRERYEDYLERRREALEDYRDWQRDYWRDQRRWDRRYHPRYQRYQPRYQPYGWDHGYRRGGGLSIFGPRGGRLNIRW